jgi:hypothetical protein
MARKGVAAAVTSPVTDAMILGGAITIKSCLVTIATGTHAQTMVCTSATGSGLYLPLCPTALATFALTAGGVTTSPTCFSSEYAMTVATSN